MSGKRQLPRAEIVRQRRAQQNSQRLKHASQQAHRPLPPVTTRGTPYVMPKRKSAPGHRFGLSLGLPHVERIGNPLHALPRPRLGWRLLSFFLILGLGAGLYFAWTSPYFRVAQAYVVGNTRLSAAEINAVLGIANQPIFMLMPKEIAARLRQNYLELASAQVKVYLPNYVWVYVTERTPVILWQQGQAYTWIDASGVAFQPRGQVAGLILVSALATPPAGMALLDDPLSPPPYLSTELAAAIQVLAGSVPAGTTLIYDPSHGLGWQDERGWQVFFGSSSKDLALKLRIYQSLVDSLTGKGITPAFISVVYPDAPFYRLAEPVEAVPITSESAFSEQ